MQFPRHNSCKLHYLYNIKKKVTTIAAFWSAVVDRLNTDVYNKTYTVQGALVRRFCILGTVTCVYIEPFKCDETLPAILERGSILKIGKININFFYFIMIYYFEN